MKPLDEPPGQPAVAPVQPPGQTTVPLRRRLGRWAKRPDKGAHRFRLFHGFDVDHDVHRLQCFVRRLAKRLAKRPDSVRLARRMRLRRRVRALPLNPGKAKG